MTDDERRKPAPDASRLPSVEWGGYTPRREDVRSRKRKELYTEATQIFQEEKPALFQEIIVYGTTKRVSFRPGRTTG
jgi:hypothetical protein